MRKENCKWASAARSEVLTAQGYEAFAEVRYISPQSSTDRVHAGQTSAVSLVNFSEQMPPVQHDVIKSETLSASRVVAGRLTADSRRSSRGFSRTRQEPSTASMQGVCFHLLQPGSVLCFCWIVHKSGSLQFAGAVWCVLWLSVCCTTLCPSTLV